MHGKNSFLCSASYHKHTFLAFVISNRNSTKQSSTSSNGDSKDFGDEDFDIFPFPWNSSLLPSDLPKSAIREKRNPTKLPIRAKKLRKAPDAPRRFKSAFIFFSIEKHRQLRDILSLDHKKERVSNSLTKILFVFKTMNFVANKIDIIHSSRQPLLQKWFLKPGSP
jgi:hypothetical protein